MPMTDQQLASVALSALLAKDTTLEQTAAIRDLLDDPDQLRAVLETAEEETS